jgi:hypothetical protein
MKHNFKFYPLDGATDVRCGEASATLAIFLIRSCHNNKLARFNEKAMFLSNIQTVHTRNKKIFKKINFLPDFLSEFCTFNHGQLILSTERLVHLENTKNKSSFLLRTLLSKYSCIE